MSAIPILPSLSDWAGRYDVIFSDVWGVVHDGLRPHRSAGEALAAFRAAGGTVVMISNAPRPAWSVVEQLDQIGVTRAAYDAVATSGDVTQALALAQPDRRCLHIGAERDRPLFENLDVERVSLDEAAFVICTGLVDDETETAQDYGAQLEAIRARGLMMICANPDLVVERGSRLIPCAGAIAALYEAMGGRVVQAGKPFQPIYEATYAKAEAILGRAPEKARILAIGDAIRTDVAGAAGFGVDCLFLSGGIHAGELHGQDELLSAEQLERFMGEQEHRPKAAMRHLT